MNILCRVTSPYVQGASTALLLQNCPQKCRFKMLSTCSQLCTASTLPKRCWAGSAYREAARKNLPRGDVSQNFRLADPSPLGRPCLPSEAYHLHIHALYCGIHALYCSMYTWHLHYQIQLTAPAMLLAWAAIPVAAVVAAKTAAAANLA